MMSENYKKLVNAAQGYVLNDDGSKIFDLLEYIRDRIRVNEKEIGEMISRTQTNVTVEQIINLFQNELEERSNYKDYSKMIISEDNFLSTALKMPIGIVAVEAYDTLEVIKYCIKAIKTKNAIAISDVEYDEYNVKSLILLIIKEALKKFDIDENLIMILPYEECFYDYFDGVVYTHDDEGNLFEEVKLEKKNKEEKLYVYLENEELREEAEKNKDAEILTGSFEEALEIINKVGAKGAAIYTKNGEVAYKFINLVKAENAFVNTSLDNIKETEECKDIWYEYRNVIIPIPEKLYEKAEKSETKVEPRAELNLKVEVSDNQNEDKDLIVVEEKNIFDKIKNFLNKLFH